jgi:hypothetical protein
VKNRNPFNWLRWTARISGTLIVLFTLSWMVGEIIEGRGRPHTTYSFQTWIFFSTWGIATGGLVLALWKESLGGIISLVSYFLVYYLSSTDIAGGNYTSIGQQYSMIMSGIVITGFLIFISGLILTKWNENVGAIISQAGYILAFIPDLIIRTGTTLGNLHTLFFISSLPSVLFLVYWKLNRDKLRMVDAVKPEETI